MTAAELARALDPKAKGHGRSWSCRCPAHEDKRPSLSIRDGDQGAILLTCHAGCERRDVIAELQQRGLWPGRSDHPAIRHVRRQDSHAKPERYDTLAPGGARLWASCMPVKPGTTAGVYLASRGCALPPPDGDLRWHPEVGYYVQGQRAPIHQGPALVALVTDVETVEPISLHRTWITATGKAELGEHNARKLLWHHRSDGVIRLWPDGDVTLGLVLGEGIETCLSAAGVGLTPCWATMSAGNLTAFPVLPRLEGLTVLVDHDRPNPKSGKRPGDVAARQLIARYVAAGFDAKRDLRIIRSPVEGEDAADLRTVA